MPPKILAYIFLPKTPLQQVNKSGTDCVINQFTPKRPKKKKSINLWLPLHEEKDNLWTPHPIYIYNNNP